MTDRPILFSGPMVRALLAGEKHQMRRVLKPQPKLAAHHEPVRFETRNADKSYWLWMCCTDRPSYQFATGDRMASYIIGDRLWVREHWRTAAHIDKFAPSVLPVDSPVFFEADAGGEAAGANGRFRQGMHMPRWASRLTLTVTDVRVERVQDISRADAIAEGLALASNQIEEFWRWPEPLHERLWLSPVAAYRDLWDSLNADRGFGWNANPWVVAISFRVHRCNIDRMGS